MAGKMYISCLCSGTFLCGAECLVYGFACMVPPFPFEQHFIAIYDLLSEDDN